jgi:hypothetical protein
MEVWLDKAKAPKALSQLGFMGNTFVRLKRCGLKVLPFCIEVPLCEVAVSFHKPYLGFVNVCTADKGGTFMVSEAVPLEGDNQS